MVTKYNGPYLAYLQILPSNAVMKVTLTYMTMSLPLYKTHSHKLLHRERPKTSQFYEVNSSKRCRLLASKCFKSMELFLKITIFAGDSCSFWYHQLRDRRALHGCSDETQNGTIAVQVYGNSALLLLNGTLLNSVNIPQALSQWCELVMSNYCNLLHCLVLTRLQY